MYTSSKHVVTLQKLKWLFFLFHISEKYDYTAATAKQDMQSYFRQASVNLSAIIKQPGVWDPFVLSYVNVSVVLFLVSSFKELGPLYGDCVHLSVCHTWFCMHFHTSSVLKMFGRIAFGYNLINVRFCIWIFLTCTCKSFTFLP